ncbi:hypothetical protein [Pontibacter sp. G13]|uniref:hypothetical protein n=1 Tax=Pontibacter sp. G13 TaxID=3074898 RepID=UPI0028893795|nr:hypothetical protein [Pontibacter sp. G13]WNJ16748.1 hypothetical protein RJD25_17920 [Pontibacter sp. G13]
MAYFNSPISVPRTFRLLFAGFVAVGMLISGCSPDDNLDDLIPEDQAPAITIVAPTNTRLLEQSGQLVTVSFRMADQEALRLFRAVPTIYDPNGNEIGTMPNMDTDLAGTNVDFDFQFITPLLPGYSKVKYTCYAIDSKGAFASAEFWVTILPNPSDPPIYEVLEYQGDSVMNPFDEINHAFNFSARRLLPAPGEDAASLVLEMDIATELEGSALGFWRPFLYSPNNDQLGLDSVFVVTNPEKFNYEEATYQTIFEAFFSDPAPATRTPELLGSGGVILHEYVIIRLTKAPAPQFAVMKITGGFDDGTGLGKTTDQLYFDYKVTSP